MCVCVCVCAIFPYISETRNKQKIQVYDGDWDNGLRHGQGLLRFADGSFYKGQFDRERKHGSGCMVWKDGSQYQGK